MQPLVHYAFLGSLVAGAAGVAVVIFLTFTRVRRRPSEPDEDGETAPGIARSVHLADTVAVACFALSATLALIGLTQHARAAGPADARLVERLDALEQRLATAEAQLEAGAATVVQPSPWEPRMERIEQRLSTVEDRAPGSERLAQDRAASPDTSRRAPEPPPARVAKPATPTKSARPPSPSSEASGAAPKQPGAINAPTTAVPAEPTAAVAAPAPSVMPSASPIAASPTPPAEQEPAAPPHEPTLGERAAAGWEAMKRDVARSGDEWLEGWRRLRRLFGD